MPTQPVVAEPRGPNIPYFTLGNDEPSPLQFADPVQTDWASPSTTGEDGPPEDSFPGMANNPNLPGPINRTTVQQSPGVAYNHNYDDGIQVNGIGSLGWITEWENNMGGLFGDAMPEGFGRPFDWPQERYQGQPMTDSEGSEQYVVWTEPLAGTTKTNPLLSQFIPWLGE